MVKMAQLKGCVVPPWFCTLINYSMVSAKFIQHMISVCYAYFAVN